MVTGHSIFSRSPERKIEQQQQKTRFKLNCVPADFMSNETNKLALINIIEEIKACRETQTNVDVIYNKLCTTIINEMNNTIPKLETKSAKKRFRHTKPYWNDHLKDLWENMSSKEKEFLKCDGNRNMRAKLRCEYTRARDLFDKALRRTER